VDDSARAALLEQLGRSKEFSGDLVGAESAYRRVGKLSDSVDTKVDSLRRRARVRQKQNRLTEAIRLLRRAERLLEGVDRETWASRRLAELHLNLAGIRTDQGRLGDARREGETAEFWAIAADDPALRVQAYGAIVGSLSEWSDAVPFIELGFGEGAPADAYEARSILAINLGMCAFFAGRWTDAVEYYELGRANAVTIGNVTGAALASMNAAEVLIDQGHIETAHAALIEVRRVLRAAGYTAALTYADLLDAVVQMRSGRIEDGVRELERITVEFRDGSMLMYALEADLRLAEAHMRAGQADRTRALAEQVLAETATLARRGVVDARALRLLGRVAIIDNDLVEAVVRLRDAESICRSEGLLFELALTLVPLAQCVDDGDVVLAEATAIFDELGVIEAGRFLPTIEGAVSPMA
jgi:tetratricopeptide (TPR) repeat protein